jgi:hypothetical protein
MSGAPRRRRPVASVRGAYCRIATSITAESRCGRPRRSIPTGPVASHGEHVFPRMTRLPTKRPATLQTKFGVFISAITLLATIGRFHRFTPP